jgi:UDP-N-acetylglucosamine 2-epimerase (non-hydrolysing)/GDP/UDP-N,N'-diacetylbacillosamine 2-epimerase (hydrolysing)
MTRRPNHSAIRNRQFAMRTVAYVTGTRADFGLMHNTLRAIQSHPNLKLQLLVTGIHLDPAHGNTINQLQNAGWHIDATIPWSPSGRDAKRDAQSHLAEQTGLATASFARAFAELGPDIVLVTGDRVEAFAAATAAHLSGRILAHVHGGDRALGQVDDALRHAITKLAHLHFPATRTSADRIRKLGEDPWRIHPVGSPGIDNITKDAWPLAQCLAALGGTGKLSELASGRPPLAPRRCALLLYHPTDADNTIERNRATQLLNATLGAGFAQTIVIYPNNDPGSKGIIEAWQRARSADRAPQSAIFLQDLPRNAFLGLLKHAAALIGNSSSGIIEAASFGTPVLDVGPRQAGRERGPNVTTIPFTSAAIRKALKKTWNNGRPRRYPAHNPYGKGDTAQRIARILADVRITDRLHRKLIAY